MRGSKVKVPLGGRKNKNEEKRALGSPKKTETETSVWRSQGLSCTHDKKRTEDSTSVPIFSRVRGGGGLGSNASAKKARGGRGTAGDTQERVLRKKKRARRNERGKRGKRCNGGGIMNRNRRKEKFSQAKIRRSTTPRCRAESRKEGPKTLSLRGPYRGGKWDRSVDRLLRRRARGKDLMGVCA